MRLKVLTFSVEPTQLRVSKTLHDKLENGPRSNVFVIGDNRKKVEALSHAAPLVKSDIPDEALGFPWSMPDLRSSYSAFFTSSCT